MPSKNTARPATKPAKAKKGVTRAKIPLFQSTAVRTRKILMRKPTPYPVQRRRDPKLRPGARAPPCQFGQKGALMETTVSLVGICEMPPFVRGIILGIGLGKQPNNQDPNMTDEGRNSANLHMYVCSAEIPAQQSAQLPSENPPPATQHQQHGNHSANLSLAEIPAQQSAQLSSENPPPATEHQQHGNHSANLSLAEIPAQQSAQLSSENPLPATEHHQPHTEPEVRDQPSAELNKEKQQWVTLNYDVVQGLQKSRHKKKPKKEK